MTFGEWLAHWWTPELFTNDNPYGIMPNELVCMARAWEWAEAVREYV